MFFRKKLDNKKKRGALSLEMMGVIAVIGAITVAGLYYMNIMMRDTKVNNAIAAMQLINTKINEMYLNERSYDGLDDEIFIKSGNAPSSIVDSTGKGMRSPWGAMTLSPVADEDGNENATFTLTFNTLPDDVCQRLGNIMQGSTAWQKVTINSTSYDIDDDADTSLVSTLSAACNASNKNTMVFTAKRQ